jgi:hypothetical protein
VVTVVVVALVVAANFTQFFVVDAFGCVPHPPIVEVFDSDLYITYYAMLEAICRVSLLFCSRDVTGEVDKVP